MRLQTALIKLFLSLGSLALVLGCTGVEVPPDDVEHHEQRHVDEALSDDDALDTGPSREQAPEAMDDAATEADMLEVGPSSNEDAVDPSTSPEETDTSPADGRARPEGECETNAMCPSSECTDGQCVSGVCVSVARLDGIACDDGTACSVGDRCQGGVCVGGVILDCSDANLCTDDFCDPAQGCVHQYNYAPCDDDDACTTADQCKGGQCIGEVFACDDLNPCTDDLCVPGTGQCFNTPDDTLPCSDLSACTAGDFCQAGVCNPGADDGCDDHNACTDDSCSQGQCQHLGLELLPCDDDDPCTVDDTCHLGSCIGAAPNTCDDGDPCTADACVLPEGCVHENMAGNPCDDEDACTTGETCDAAGACVANEWVSCDDESPCTVDSCDPASGCVFIVVAGACDDHDACTDGDACILGVCHGTPIECDDGDMCTEDSCDPVLGCQSIDVSEQCQFEDTCMAGSCDPELGCVLEQLSGTCDDGFACTDEDTCQLGNCIGVAVDCDDANECSTDVCDEEEGCVHVWHQGPCDDGDPCTVEGQCGLEGLCTSGPSVNIDDGIACTIDSCTKASGIQHTPDDTLCAPGRVCDLGLGCRLVSPSLLFVKVALTGSKETEAPWVAVANISAMPISLEGLTLVNAKGEVALLETGEDPLAVIGPGALAAIIQSQGQPTNIPTGFTATFEGEASGDFFDPAGDSLILQDEHGAAIDSLVFSPLLSQGSPGGSEFVSIDGSPTEFDAVAAIVADSQDANDPAGLWCAWPAGSGAPEGPPLSCARSLLNEVNLWVTEGRYIELHLPSGGPMTGLSLEFLDPTGVTLGVVGPLSGRAPVGNYSVLFDGESDVVLPQMSSGTVHLIRQGVRLDTYGFGTLADDASAATDWPPAEGEPGPVGEPGYVAARQVDGLDTDENAVDWMMSETPTPGTMNQGAP